MPLVRIDAVKGRSGNEIQGILDATHTAMASAFHEPRDVRVQIYQEHAAEHLIAEGIGGGTGGIVLITLIGLPQSQEVKQAFFRNLCRELRGRCSVEPRDVIVSVLTNSIADWSLGNGEQPFITERI